MKTIEPSLSASGYKLTQIHRNGSWAVYEQTKAARVYSYELVKIICRPAETAFGKSYPEREVYPSSEQWGTHGFTVMDRHEAIARCDKLASGELQDATN